jgi:hypothetical protein
MRAKKEFKHRNGHTQVVEHSAVHIAELEERMNRSSLVCFGECNDSKAALFHDGRDDKFTLLVKHESDDVSLIFDCVQREQWGRNVMVFGHVSGPGKFVASGHATLNKGRLCIKLVDGNIFHCDVDSNAKYLKPYVFEEPIVERARTVGFGQMKKDNRRQTVHPKKYQPSGVNVGFRGNFRPIEEHSFSDDEPDFSEEDLARLRGELPV